MTTQGHLRPSPHHPGGQEKTQGPISTVRQATIYAAYVLRDNALVLKSDAQRFSVRLGNVPLGAEGLLTEDTG